MGLEMLFILALAMLIFGPKKLPEISRTIGTFMAEFRRAGYEFKSQIEDEVRKLEIEADQDKRKEDKSKQVSVSSNSGSETNSVSEPPVRQIMPPSVGETVGMRRANAFHDESFDSMPSTEEANVAPSNENENAQGSATPEAEIMRGPNA
jgi:sec-independent protein translocase protein TatA